MELKGKFKKQLEVVEKNNFKSRKVWIETAENEKYPQTIEIEVHQDKVDMFNGVSEGAPVTCHCNLRGREWTGTDGVTKVFNSIVCWRVEAAFAPVAGNAMVAPVPELDSTNDLPF